MKPGKLKRLVGVTGLVAAAALLPTAAWAGDHGWKRQVQGHPDWRDHGHRNFTIITQPKQQLQIRPHRPHFSQHHSYGYAAPSQPVWVAAAWHWTGYQWVLVPGYWAW